MAFFFVLDHSLKDKMRNVPSQSLASSSRQPLRNFQSLEVAVFVFPECAIGEGGVGQVPRDHHHNYEDPEQVLRTNPPNFLSQSK
jgi:hypothetical protein